MKGIVINALPYKPNSSGIGVMIRELFGRYVERTGQHCLVVLPQDGPAFPTGADTELVRVPIDHGQGIRRILFQSFQMGRQYCKDAVLLTTDSKTPFFLPKSCLLVPLITDLAVFRMPEVYKSSRVALWKLQYQYIQRKASFFLAISEFTKREVVQILGTPEEKIHVIPMACADSMHPVTDQLELAAIRKKYGLGEHFILFVGNNNPRKNLERTIQAFDRMKTQTGLPHQLVIAGEQGWKFDQANALVQIQHAGDVRFTGFVPDEDVLALYSAADLFAFPTLYEGFGIPVLEAQTCGAPVLTSNVSSLPEVAGDGAVLVDPRSVDEIAHGMAQILMNKELAMDLVQKGYRNASRYSWDRSADILRETVEREVHQRGCTRNIQTVGI